MNQMKSLKTDDILGARPKIRHPPRNLVREQQISHQYGNSIDSAYPQQYYPHNNFNTHQNQPHQYHYQYPYVNQIPQNQYNQNQANIEPLTHYQNSENPYPPRNSSYINNVDLSQSYHENSPKVAGRSSNRIN